MYIQNIKHILVQGPGTSLQEICRSSVTQLEFVDAETLVSSSSDGTTRVWSVVTGAQKELGETIGIDTASLGLGVSAGIGFAIEGGATAAVEQEVGKYSIAFKDDLLLISEGQSGVDRARSCGEDEGSGREGESECGDAAVGGRRRCPSIVWGAHQR